MGRTRHFSKKSLFFSPLILLSQVICRIEIALHGVLADWAVRNEENIDERMQTLPCSCSKRATTRGSLDPEGDRVDSLPQECNELFDRRSGSFQIIHWSCFFSFSFYPMTDIPLGTEDSELNMMSFFSKYSHLSRDTHCPSVYQGFENTHVGWVRDVWVGPYTRCSLDEEDEERCEDWHCSWDATWDTPVSLIRVPGFESCLQLGFQLPAYVYSGNSQWELK